MAMVACVDRALPSPSDSLCNCANPALVRLVQGSFAPSCALLISPFALTLCHYAHADSMLSLCSALPSEGTLPIRLLPILNHSSSHESHGIRQLWEIPSLSMPPGQGELCLFSVFRDIQCFCCSFREQACSSVWNLLMMHAFDS